MQGPHHVRNHNSTLSTKPTTNVCTRANQWEKGRAKGCDCLPEVTTRATLVDAGFHQAVLDALQDIRNTPREPRVECPGELTNVPSKFFLENTSKDFCQTVMSDLKARRELTPYDINGNRKPILQAALATQEQMGHALTGRSPPENIKSYGDYTIFLSYAPLDGKCLVDAKDLCRNAWDRLVRSNCKYMSSAFDFIRPRSLSKTLKTHQLMCDFQAVQTKDRREIACSSMLPSMLAVASSHGR